MSKHEGQIFEDDVRRVARALWPSAAFDGSTIFADRERDGVFYGEFQINCIECTTDVTKQKAQIDLTKLNEIVLALRRKNLDTGVRGWFVTKQEPTAAQREAASSYRGIVTILSFDQFRSMLIDASSYLSSRERYPFGSVRSIEDDGPTVDRDEFVPIDLVDPTTDKLHSLRSITDRLTRQHARYVLEGDYGSGKSMTLRELFFQAVDNYKQGRTRQFPIFLNLRDHGGQNDPAEAFYRHGRRVGIDNERHLNRAWRAGYVMLFLDGFDEMAPRGAEGFGKTVQDVRYRALDLLRRLIKDSRSEISIIFSGRSHFFDDRVELCKALAITGQWTFLTLNDFTEQQVQTYLNKKGLKARVPSWLPKRPLLVGYLASRGFLEEISTSPESEQKGVGWDELLDHICEREVGQIEPGMSGSDLRHVIERLATKARKKSDRLGPLSHNELRDTFEELRGYGPEEKGLITILRLPGMKGGFNKSSAQTNHTNASPGPEGRIIDEDLADAAAAGDVVRYIQNPFNFDQSVFAGCRHSLGYVGLGVCVNKCRKKDSRAGHLGIALKRLCDVAQGSVVIVDVFNVMVSLKYSYGGEDITVRDVVIEELRLGSKELDYSKISFEDCYILRLYLQKSRKNSLLPMFRSCYFGVVHGCRERKELVMKCFDEHCEVERIENP